jgi:hypothetical protein
MPCITSLDGSNRWMPPVWPEDSACKEASSPSTTSPSAVEAAASLDEERPFEELLAEVLFVVIEDEERSTTIIRDALQAEREWQKILSKLIDGEHTVLTELRTRNGFAQKISDIVPFASLVVGGVLAMAASGTLSLLPLGAVALGALFALDTLLDNKIKKAVISWLGVRSEHDSKAWLQTICAATTAAAFCVGIGLNNPSGLLVAQNAAGFVADTAEAGTRVALDRQTARLTENDRKQEKSKNRLHELFGDADLQAKTITGLYEMLTNLQGSTALTTERIFRA